jgi:hypothetical protein
MNKPYNIQNTNICNDIFHISFFKALLLLINEGETTRYHPNAVDGIAKNGNKSLCPQPLKFLAE